MDPVITSGLIMAGGSLAGGLMGKSAADKAREQEAAVAASNVALQREFAQNGIRWKVEDAKRAGIHPLYALGASTQSFSPVSVGSGPDNSMANAMSNIGQDIGRAVSQTRTAQEKEIAALNLASAKADLEGKVIENQFKAKQLQNLQTAAPSMPSGSSTNFIPGQGNSPLLKVNSAERTVSQPGRYSQEAGWTPDVGYARTDTGLTPVPSKDVKERIEDQFIPEMMWALRNQIMPNFAPFSKNIRTPPTNMLPKGANKWVWSYKRQEWQPVYADGKNPPVSIGDGR